jgi:hypothetical protein
MVQAWSTSSPSAQLWSPDHSQPTANRGRSPTGSIRLNAATASGISKVEQSRPGTSQVTSEWILPSESAFSTLVNDPIEPGNAPALPMRTRTCCERSVSSGGAVNPLNCS